MTRTGALAAAVVAALRVSLAASPPARPTEPEALGLRRQRQDQQQAPNLRGRERHERGVASPFSADSTGGAVSAGTCSRVASRKAWASRPRVIWLGLTLTRRHARALVIVLAILLSTLVFGAYHLPQAIFLFGRHGVVVAFTLLGNGLLGVTFGWLYWKRGLLSAMVAHFGCDVILHVVIVALPHLR